jgi:cation transporter-like permease
MYYISEPPYFLLVAGLFVALTSGAAFSGTLKQIVNKWSAARAAEAIAKLPTGQLVVPFLGISAGVCMFLASGMEIFGFTKMLSYIVAVPLTLATCLLVWYQLNSMLALVEREGTQAFNIDSW